MELWLTDRLTDDFLLFCLTQQPYAGFGRLLRHFLKHNCNGIPVDLTCVVSCYRIQNGINYKAAC